MSNEAPETREEMAKWLLCSPFTAHPSERVDLVWSWLTAARVQGRAEALADVTEVEWEAWCRHPTYYFVDALDAVNALLASRRRPVAAAGNEEWDRSG